MKKIKYTRYGDEWPWLKGAYGCDHIGYFRHPRTFNEIRQNKAAKADGHYVRPRRCASGWGRLPNAWDDVSYSFMYKKCWKRFTRRRHQWKE